MQIVEAHLAEYIPTIRELFTEYASEIEVDLCFQSFDRELAELPGCYAPPEGRLFLALEDSSPAGCVAMRKTGEDVCEIKRLYVRPAFRKQGLGRHLADRVIAAARETGYARMRLDTLGTMRAAIALYQSLGFQRIAPYYHNPSGCAVFMELALR